MCRPRSSSVRVFQRGEAGADGRRKPKSRPPPLRYSAGTSGGVSGPLVAAPADETPGCTPADYDGLPVKGAVVLVDRGSCPFTEKLAIAAKLGARGHGRRRQRRRGDHAGCPRRRTTPSRSRRSASPRPTGRGCAPSPVAATLQLDAQTPPITSRNVIAQTKTGSTENVVMVGGAPRQRPRRPGHQRQRHPGWPPCWRRRVQLGSRPGGRPTPCGSRFWGAEEVGTRRLHEVRRSRSTPSSSGTSRCISTSTCSPRPTPGTSPTTATSRPHSAADEAHPAGPGGLGGYRADPGRLPRGGR